MRFDTFLGPAIAPVIPDLARLRVTVFADWPYLYQGDVAYERDYLRDYAKDGAILVAAYDGETMVGAATGMPLALHADALSEAFTGLDIDAHSIFYCAESVLLPEYRGQGAGHRFFDAREAHARSLNASHGAFCAVMRPDTHPARPGGYRPLGSFWRARGYAPVPGAVARFTWRDIGAFEQTEKPLQVWMKPL